MLAEEPHAEHRRRDHLEVQQQRDGAGKGPAQRDEQEHGAEHAAEEDRAGETCGVRPIEAEARPAPVLERRDRQHRERGAEVEESRELERLERAEEQLAGGRGGAEEQGGEEREEERAHPTPGPSSPARPRPGDSARPTARSS